MGTSLELGRLSPMNWFRTDSGSPRDISVRTDDRQDVLPLSRLHRGIDRIFEDFFDDFGLMSAGSGWVSGGQDMLRPKVDIVEGKQAYMIEVEVPGVEQQDIDVRVREGTLTIAGEKRKENREDGAQMHRVERSYGAFRRTIELPDDVDDAAISAQFKSGVLTVTVPRKPEAVQQSEGKKIEVSAA